MHPRILVAPLGWGLGHATRCLPIAAEIERQGGEVVWASDDRALALLRHECIGCEIFEMPSYGINYDAGSMVWNMARQIPKIIRAIRAEHRWLKTFAQKERITAIISDNRYGCYHATIPSIFVGHQLNLIVPGAPIAWAAKRLQAALIRQFDACWVPDYQVIGQSLSGILGHGGIASTLPNLQYVGPLTRFSSQTSQHNDDQSNQEVVVLLSGPEPQRTILETKILIQAESLPYRVLVVRGTPESNESWQAAPHVRVVSSLHGIDLANAIWKAKVLISRPGYSTLMDLAGLASAAKVLLVPTPGQTEQMYLANYFQNRHIALYRQQDDLDLVRDISHAMAFSGFENKATPEQALLSRAVQRLIAMA